MSPSCALPLLLAAAASAPRTVVLGMEAQSGVSRQTAQVLTDELVARVQQLATGRSVLGPSDIRRLLGYEAKRAKFGSADVKTLGKVGATLGADELVSGTIARLGTTVLITVSRFNVAEVAIRAEQTEKLQQPKSPDLLAAIDRIAARLYPPPAADEPVAAADPSGTNPPAGTSAYGASQPPAYPPQPYGQPAYPPQPYGQPAYPPPAPVDPPPAYPQPYYTPPPATYVPPAWPADTAGEVAGAMLSMLPYLAPVRPRFVVRRPFFPPPFF